MTTDRQREANRRNAQNSTGPRSRAGRAKASQNALKHGLTTSPAAEPIRRFFRIILSDPDAQPDPFDTDPLRRAALRLAEAEARRERTEHVEAEHLADMTERALKQGRRTLLELGKAGVDDPEFLKVLIENEPDPVQRQGLRILLAANPHRSSPLLQKLKSLRRYRRSAEAERRRALRDWLALSEAEVVENKEFRNEANFALELNF